MVYSCLYKGHQKKRVEAWDHGILLMAPEARRLAHRPRLPAGCAGRPLVQDPPLLGVATMANVAGAMCRLRLLAQDIGQGSCTSFMVKFQALDLGPPNSNGL